MANLATPRPVAASRALLRLTLLGGALTLSACVGEPLPDHGGPILPDTSGGATDTDGGGTPDIGEVKCTDKADCEKTVGDVGQCNVVSCGADGKCKVSPKAPDTPCDADGSACTVKDFCSQGTCKAGPAKDCDDDNTCTEDSCETIKGDCVNKPAKDGAGCDDGEDCTYNDACKAGTCKGGDNVCKCSADDVSQCWQELGLAKGDKCAGTPVCEEYTDKGKKLRKCALNEATKVVCATGKDTDCSKNTCDPKDGVCKFKNVAEGEPCKDEVECTTNEKCKAGKCVPGTSLCFCTPGDVSKCWGKLNLFEEDKLCTGTPYCAQIYDKASDTTDYKCELNKASVVFCSNAKDTACQANTCNPKDGSCSLKPQNINKAGCDDGNPCTPNDSCNDKGECTPDTKDDVDCSPTKACPKGKVCYNGRCGENTCTCDSDADCEASGDGNFCNGTLFCNKAEKVCQLNPATVITCADGNDTACVVNFCYSATGKCKLTPRENLKKEVFYEITGVPPNLVKKAVGEKVNAYPTKQVPVFCDDGNPCTVNEECTKGQCVSPLSICKCQTNADCAGEEDGNACNGTLYCDKVKGVCEINPSTVKKCPGAGDNECAVGSCDPKTGNCTVKPVANDKPCDDDDLCTASDTCQNGTCVSGTKICVCQSDADCGKQEDGNLCNGTMYCDKTNKNDKGEVQPACKVNPATVVTCSPGLDTECLKNQCNVKTGKCAMQPANEYKSCDAGTPCAASPVCSGGKCAWTTNLCNCAEDKDCADIVAGNACLGEPYCDKTTGGLCKLNTNKIPTCLEGAGSDCMENRCNPADGKCKLFEKSNFTPCNDGNTCTVSDTCTDGKCKSGTDVCQCSSDADCVPFDDGDLCNGKLVCDKTGGQGKCVPNPASVPAPCKTPGASDCIVELCEPKTGMCEPKTDVTKCNDNNPCTVDSCNTKTQQCEHKAVSAGSACIDPGTGVGVCVDDSSNKSVCQPPPKDDVLFVPGGTVAVGCNPKVQPGGCADSTESPIHSLKVSAFWMQRFEVTVEDYKKCVTAGQCTAAGTGPDCNAAATGRDKHPINCVTWKQAGDYCGFYQTAARLPREAEWAKAARGGCEFYTSCKDEAQTYVWGNTPDPDCNRAVHDEVFPAGSKKAGKGLGCGENSTLPVGSLLEGDKSLYGINDLGGNVSEWIADFYSGTWYGESGATVDDTAGPTSGSQRVVRGAAWTTKTTDVRVAKRSFADPTKGSASIGFRCVIPLK